MKKPFLILGLTNNTAGVLPVSLFVPGNPNDLSNQRTRYTANITSVLPTLPLGLPVSITAQGNPSAPVITYGPQTAYSVGGIIAILNSFSIGSFSSYVSGGNTFIFSNNDTISYGNLVIGPPGNFLWSVTGVPVGTTYNVSVTDLTTPTTLFTSGNNIISGGATISDPLFFSTDNMDYELDFPAGFHTSITTLYINGVQVAQFTSIGGNFANVNYASPIAPSPTDIFSVVFNITS